MKTLEKERDYYKGECELLQGMMRKRLTAAGSSGATKRKGKGKVRDTTLCCSAGLLTHLINAKETGSSQNWKFPNRP